MPPRFAYWTIILEGKPTAFRAQQREELLPTIKQLQNKHPDVVMKWFARGKLWDSPEQARAAQRPPRERRTGDWRPGGEHRDPRARFEVTRDEKRRRFAASLRRDARDRGDRESPPHERRGEEHRKRPVRSLTRDDRPPKTAGSHEQRPKEPRHKWAAPGGPRTTERTQPGRRGAPRGRGGRGRGGGTR